MVEKKPGTLAVDHDVLKIHGEIYNLKWIDVDFERQTIRITAEKNNNPRIF